MTDAAPAQYKQKSRKGKKAWRKNVDVTEVASGLDEVRDQIIAGQVARSQPSIQHTFSNLLPEASSPKSPRTNSSQSTPPATLPSRKKSNRATSL
jgi:hypothetical protein